MLLVRWMKYTIYTVYVRWTFISRSRNHSNEKWIDMENLLYFQCVLKGCCFLFYRSLCELYVHLQLVILVWADRGKELFHSFSKFNYCVPFCWEFSLYGWIVRSYSLSIIFFCGLYHESILFLALTELSLLTTYVFNFIDDIKIFIRKNKHF